MFLCCCFPFVLSSTVLHTCDGSCSVKYRQTLMHTYYLAMYLFCPTCGNLLVVEEGPTCYRFACNSCPYVQDIKEKVLCIYFGYARIIFHPPVPVGFFFQISSSKRSRRCTGRLGSLGERRYYWWWVFPEMLGCKIGRSVILLFFLFRNLS